VPYLDRFPAVLAACGFFAVGLFISGCTKSDATGRESFQKAERYFAEGDYGSAEVEYKNTLRANPRDTTALLRMAEIWEARGGPFQAAVFLRKVQELNPADVEARLGMAEFLIAIGDRNSARGEVEKVLKTAPDHRDALVLLAKASSTAQQIKDAEARLAFPAEQTDGQVWFARAILALSRGDAEAAESALGRAMEIDGDSSQLHAFKATLHLVRKDTAAAEHCLKTAVNLAPPRSPEKITYASFLLAENRRPEAVSLLESATKAAPDFIAAWRLLARIALSENDRNKAHHMLQKVSSWDATDFEANVLMAMLHLSDRSEGARDKAIELLESLRSSHPPNALVEYYLARARLAGKQTDLAMDALARAVRIDPNMRDALLLQGGLKLAQRRFEEVISLVEPYLRHRQGDIDAALLLSEAYRRSRHPAKARAVLATILNEPHQARWYLEKAAVAKDLGEPANARIALEKVESIDPSNNLATAELVGLDMQAGNHDRALERAEKQLKLHPEDATAFYLRAAIFAKQSRDNEAFADLNEALRIDPKLIAAHLMIAKILSSAGKSSEAILQLEKAKASAPDNLPGLLMLASLYDETGRKAEARSCYEAILKRSPQYVPALNNLATILGESTGADLERAYQLAQQATSLSPDDRTVSETLGWILYKKGEFKRAHRHLTEAAGKLADDATVQFHHAMSCLAMGDETAARRALLATLAADAGFARRAEVEGLLARLDASAGTVEALEGHIKRQPLDMTARLKLARIHEATGMYRQAADVYVAALAINRDLYPAVARLAHLHEGQLNDPAKAYQYARQATEMSPQDTSIEIILAKLAFRNGEHERADLLFQNNLTYLKEDAALIMQAAWAAYSVGRVADAKALMEEAMAKSKDHNHRDEAQLFLGFIAHPPAPGLIETTLTKDPRYVPALMARADRNANKDAKAALQGYEAVLKIYPRFKPASEAAERLRAGSSAQ